MKNKKLIVFMRSKNFWIKQIPELRTYPYIELKVPRNPYFNNKNMTEDSYNLLLDSLR